MGAAENCWEVLACGREPGGQCVHQLGVCPAATDDSADGINGGRNAGRICWTVAGTFCGGRVQGSAARKRLTCLHCDFFDQMMREQSAGGSLSTTSAESGATRLGLAAWILAAFWAVLLAASVYVGGGAVDARAAVLTGLGIAVSLSFGALLQLRTPRAALLLPGAFAFLAFHTFTLSAAEFVLDSRLFTFQVSSICILILTFPLLIPGHPTAVFRGSLVAASACLLVYGVAMLAGSSIVSDPVVMLSRVLPPFACAAMAVLPARLLYRLHADVKRAQRLGSYELVAPIGAGGMGEVWRARHRMLARPAAVKLIRPRSTGNQRYRDRFEREAQATATLESPHTVQLYDFGIAEDGSFYYVMELLKGIDAHALVSRFGPVPQERAVFLLRQACDSLDDAHRMGLVHRDIKPSNLFISSRGRHRDFVKILDFGLVKFDLRSADAQATTVGQLIGTPAFMPPEVVDGRVEVGPPADIYSLGCVAYWLLTGKLVFGGETTMAMAVAHVSKSPVPPSYRCEADVAGELDDLVMRCLDKDPPARPTAVELDRGLAACRVGQHWDETRAEEWWSAHLPSGRLERPASRPDPELTAVTVGPG
jgi:serine/threonine-protein kinase